MQACIHNADVNYTMACDSGYELLTQDGYLIEGAQVDICVNVSWKTDFNVSIRDHSCKLVLQLYTSLSV